MYVCMYVYICMYNGYIYIYIYVIPQAWLDDTRVCIYMYMIHQAWLDDTRVCIYMYMIHQAWLDDTQEADSRELLEVQRALGLSGMPNVLLTCC